MHGVASFSSDSVPSAVCSAAVCQQRERKKREKEEEEGPGFCFSMRLPVGVWLRAGDDGDDGWSQGRRLQQPMLAFECPLLMLPAVLQRGAVQHCSTSLPAPAPLLWFGQLQESGCVKSRPVGAAGVPRMTHSRLCRLSSPPNSLDCCQSGAGRGAPRRKRGRHDLRIARKALSCLFGASKRKNPWILSLPCWFLVSANIKRDAFPSQ